jgi:hypothetical protein
VTVGRASFLGSDSGSGAAGMRTPRLALRDCRGDANVMALQFDDRRKQVESLFHTDHVKYYVRIRFSSGRNEGFNFGRHERRNRDRRQGKTGSQGSYRHRDPLALRTVLKLEWAGITLTLRSQTSSNFDRNFIFKPQQFFPHQFGACIECIEGCLAMLQDSRHRQALSTVGSSICTPGFLMCRLAATFPAPFTKSLLRSSMWYVAFSLAGL